MQAIEKPAPVFILIQTVKFMARFFSSRFGKTVWPSYSNSGNKNDAVSTEKDSLFPKDTTSGQNRSAIFPSGRT